ncbi:BRO-N domain-containing protein [Devriesea agamarum]|uniref:hypothetical protein n=1 Tax=Devriesea agamarum TaxID=472569 RepID=UPI00071DC93D|nr:hypothetical protein [Devriesea agamarum]
MRFETTKYIPESDKPIRAIIDDQTFEAWFHLGDVAEAYGYSDTSVLLRVVGVQHTERKRWEHGDDYVNKTSLTLAGLRLAARHAPNQRFVAVDDWIIHSIRDRERKPKDGDN